MSDNRTFYWLKLQKDFFNSLRIKKLRKLAAGDTYTIIYLKMQLLSLQNAGKLFYKGIEPTFYEEIALDIDEAADDVMMAISYLLNTGLMVQLTDTEYELPYAKNSIGVTNTESQKRLERMHRQKKETRRKVSGIIPPELEIDKELEKDNRESEHARGSFSNVNLSDEQLADLKANYSDWQEKIDHLSEYMAKTGKNYANHYAVIVGWAREDKKKARGAQNFAQRDTDYDAILRGEDMR